MEIDGFTLSHWFAIARPADVRRDKCLRTQLLGQRIEVRDEEGGIGVFSASGDRLPIQERYGHIWTSLSDAPRPLYDMPEFEEAGRRLVTAGAIRVKCSGLRAVENFIDMAHFPFVHTGILGTEDHPEVAQYIVETRAEVDEVWASKCTFYQPMAAAAATGGQITEYQYRVPHPYSTVLYKTCPPRPDENDLVGLFIQPLDEETCDVHSFVLVYDEENSDKSLLHFQQNIFMQDRMILENQVPRRLPLDPRSEIPARADATSIAFRRWLAAHDVTYGVVYPAKVA